MMDVVKAAPGVALLWWLGIVIYSYWWASTPESGWFMSFGNSLLNGMIVWLLVTLIRDLRKIDASAIRTEIRLKEKGK